MDKGNPCKLKTCVLCGFLGDRSLFVRWRKVCLKCAPRDKKARGEAYRKGKAYIKRTRSSEFLEKARKYVRKSTLKVKYGLSEEDYNTLYKHQGGVCKVCGGTNKNMSKLAVDHSHITGKVRGLLCIRCNTVLGAVNDSKSLLKRLIKYLQGA